MSKRIVYLSTIDNPFDPYSQYEDWLAYDIQLGYNTNGYLARIANTFESMTEQEASEAVEEAIDNIVSYDPLKKYVKIVKTI